MPTETPTVDCTCDKHGNVTIHWGVPFESCPLCAAVNARKDDGERALARIATLRETLYDGLTEIAEQYNRSSAMQEALLELGYTCRDFVLDAVDRFRAESPQAPFPLDPQCATCITEGKDACRRPDDPPGSPGVSCPYLALPERLTAEQEKRFLELLDEETPGLAPVMVEKKIVNLPEHTPPAVPTSDDDSMLVMARASDGIWHIARNVYQSQTDTRCGKERMETVGFVAAPFNEVPAEIRSHFRGTPVGCTACFATLAPQPMPNEEAHAVDLLCETGGDRMPCPDLSSEAGGCDADGPCKRSDSAVDAATGVCTVPRKE